MLCVFVTVVVDINVVVVPYQSPNAVVAGVMGTSHYINTHNKRFEADETVQKTSLAAVAAQSPADLSKLISKVLEEKLGQFGIKPNKQPNSTKPSGASERKGAYRKTSRNSPPKEQKNSPPRNSHGTASSPRLVSVKNKDNPPGSKTYARC